MQAVRKQRKLYFMRVSKNCKLLTELFVIQSEGRGSEGWFEDRHLQEVLMLLRDPIKVKVVSFYEQAGKQRRKDKEKSESKRKKVKEDPEIMTGQSVKIGFKFTDSYLHYNFCLMPAEMGAPVWMHDDAAHAGGGFSYARLFPKKLVVHVCEHHPAAVANTTSQLMKSFCATPPAKNQGISSYFPRMSDPDFAEPNCTKSAAKKHSKLKKIVKEMSVPLKSEMDGKAKTTHGSTEGGFLVTNQDQHGPQTMSHVLDAGEEYCAMSTLPSNHSRTSSGGSSSDDIPCSLSTRLNKKVDAELVSSVKELMPQQLSTHQQGAKNALKGTSDCNDDRQRSKSPSRHKINPVPFARKGQKSPVNSACISSAVKLSQSTLSDFAYQPKSKQLNRMKLSLKRSRRTEAVDETKSKDSDRSTVPDSESTSFTEGIRAGSQNNEESETFRPPKSTKFPQENFKMKGNKERSFAISCKKNTVSTSSDDELMTTSFLHSATSLHRSPLTAHDTGSERCQERVGGGLCPGKTTLSLTSSPTMRTHSDSCESTSDYGAKDSHLSSPPTNRNYSTRNSRPNVDNDGKGDVNVRRNLKLKRAVQLEGLMADLCWSDEEDNARRRECLKGVKRKKEEMAESIPIKGHDAACSPSKKIHRTLREIKNKVNTQSPSAYTHGVCQETIDVDEDSDDDGTGKAVTGERDTEDVTSNAGQSDKGHYQGDEVIDLSQGDDDDSDHWFDSIFGDIRYVRDLKEEDVVFLIKKNKRYLRSIFQGKRACERHQCYKHKGAKRLGMASNVRLGPFREEQMDAVMGEIVKMYCSKHFKYMDYISKVLVPEAMTKIYMDVHGVTYIEAEEVMRGARTEQPRKGS